MARVTNSLRVGLPAVLLVLGGCATPVEKSEITPKLYPAAEKNVALSVLEERPYVLSGDKSPKFEGITRSGFGVPHSFDRPRRPKDERFVDLLAGMIRDGLTDAGSNVIIVSMPVGATFQDTWPKMRSTGAGRWIVVRVVESNVTHNPYREKTGYRYDFSVFVGGPGGFETRSKRFAAVEQSEKSAQYNAFDADSIRYRKIIESMFTDPEIQGALKK